MKRIDICSLCAEGYMPHHCSVICPEAFVGHHVGINRRLGNVWSNAHAIDAEKLVDRGPVEGGALEYSIWHHRTRRVCIYVYAHAVHLFLNV